MQAWITNVMEQFGYIGIFLIIALENIFPPIPSEVILPFGGFMTTYTSLTVPGVIAAATAGSVAGALVLYGIGRLLSVERLERMVDRWGRWLRVKPEDIAKANRTFHRYGVWAGFFRAHGSACTQLDFHPGGHGEDEYRAVCLVVSARHIDLEYGARFDRRSAWPVVGESV